MALHALAGVGVIVHAKLNATYADAVHVVEAWVTSFTEVISSHDYLTAVFGNRVAGLRIRANVVIGGASSASELIVAYAVFNGLEALPRTQYEIISTLHALAIAKRAIAVGWILDTSSKLGVRFQIESFATLGAEASIPIFLAVSSLQITEFIVIKHSVW